MSRPLAVLRPEPGNGETARRIEALGLAAIRLPLFQVVPLAWEAPDPGSFDALLLSSANAPRHAGPQIHALKGLPIFAVGRATAAAARALGLDVFVTGTGDAEMLIAEARRHGVTRALHLGGREAMIAPGGIVARSIPVYASEPAAIDDGAVRTLRGTVVLVHSARAGARLAALADAAGMDRATTGLAAISAAAAQAAGTGWERVVIASRPEDAALIDAAARLTD